MDRIKETMKKIPKAKYIFLLFISMYMIYILGKCASGFDELGQMERYGVYALMGIIGIVAILCTVMSVMALLMKLYLTESDTDKKD